MREHDPDTQSNAASLSTTVQSNTQLTDGSPTLHAVCPDCPDFEGVFRDDIAAHVAAAEHELDTGHDPTVRRVVPDGGQPGPDPVAERGYLAAVTDRVCGRSDCRADAVAIVMHAEHGRRAACRKHARGKPKLEVFGRV